MTLTEVQRTETLSSELRWVQAYVHARALNNYILRRRMEREEPQHEPTRLLLDALRQADAADVIDTLRAVYYSLPMSDLCRYCGVAGDAASELLAQRGCTVGDIVRFRPPPSSIALC